MSSPPVSLHGRPSPPAAANSYGDILKSTSIIGGSAAINLIIGMAGAKAGAVFLGPEGVGLVKLYQSVFNLLSTFSGLGINSSGMREVAEAVGSGDQDRIHRIHVKYQGKEAVLSRRRDP